METELKPYTIIFIGEFDHVDEIMALDATSIEDAVIHVLCSDDFKDYDTHITVDYFPNGTEANICVWLPFGVCVIYNVGENNEEEVN